MTTGIISGVSSEFGEREIVPSSPIFGLYKQVVTIYQDQGPIPEMMVMNGGVTAASADNMALRNMMKKASMETVVAHAWTNPGQIREFLRTVAFPALVALSQITHPMKGNPKKYADAQLGIGGDTTNPKKHDAYHETTNILPERGTMQLYEGENIELASSQKYATETFRMMQLLIDKMLGLFRTPPSRQFIGLGSVISDEKGGYKFTKRPTNIDSLADQIKLHWLPQKDSERNKERSLACAYDTIGAMLAYGFIEDQDTGVLFINPLGIDYADRERIYREDLKDGRSVHKTPYQEELPDDLKTVHVDTISEWMQEYIPPPKGGDWDTRADEMCNFPEDKVNIIARWEAIDRWVDKVMKSGCFQQEKEEISVYDFIATGAIIRAFNIPNKKVEAVMQLDITDPMMIARNVGGDYSLSNQEMWDVDELRNWSLYMAAGIGEAFCMSRSTGTTMPLLAEEVSTRNRVRPIYDHIQRSYKGYRNGVGQVSNIRLLMADNMMGSVTESQMDAAQFCLPSFVRMKLSGMTDRSEDVNKVFAIREAEIQRTYEPITIKRGKADISHLIPEPGSRESEKIHHLSLLTTVDSAIVENKTRSRPFIKWTFPRLFKMRNLNDKSSQEYKDEERRRRWMFWIGKMSNGDVSMSDGYIVDSKMELEKLRNGRITLEMGKTMLGESIVYKDEAETDTVGAQAPKHTLNDTAGLAGRSVQPHTEPQPQIENENRSVAVSTAAVPEDGPSQSETDLPRPNIDQSTHDDPGPPVSDEDRKRIEDDRAKRAENAKKGRRKR